MSTQIDPELVERLAAPIAERFRALRDRIDAAAGSRAVRLVAVSKVHPPEAVLAARRVGIDCFGENYAQELAAKHAAVAGTEPDPAAAQVEWHFIGQLQTNKVRQVADIVSVWQSVDRPKVGTEIAKRAPGATVFAQVNLAEDPHKAGCSFEQLPALVEHLVDKGLQVAGLMGVGTAADEPATAAGFRRLRTAAEQFGLHHCSMGMTEDLELAVAEGSTMVRIGTALFGPRR